MAFGQWFAVGLVLAGLFWSVVLAVGLLFVVFMFAGPILALVVVVLGLVAVGLGIVTLANSTEAGKAAKQASIERQRGF